MPRRAMPTPRRCAPSTRTSHATSAWTCAWCPSPTDSPCAASATSAMNGWPLAQYLVHLGYTLQLFALLARDVLWLRGLLVAAQSVLAAYAWWHGLWPYVFWNALFV